jgi:uncharacterized repeat protein (TIGR04138 family)
MGQDVKFWEAVKNICRTDDRFKPEAYSFIIESLDFTLRQLKEQRHVTAEELFHGLCDHAKAKYGMLARTVLAAWGIESSSDIGLVVYNLVDAGVLSKQDSDRYEDFKGYNLEEFLDERYFD